MSDKHLRRKEVEELTGLSRSTIYRLMNAGDFPRPVRITQKAVAWPSSVIDKWLSDRPKVSA